MNLIARGGLGAKAGRLFIEATGRHPADIGRILGRTEKTSRGMATGELSFDRVVSTIKLWNQRCDERDRVRLTLEACRGSDVLTVSRTHSPVSSGPDSSPAGSTTAGGSA